MVAAHTDQLLILQHHNCLDLPEEYRLIYESYPLNY